MSLVSFPRASRPGQTSSTEDLTFRPGLERLEDRATPALLISDVPANISGSNTNNGSIGGTGIGVDGTSTIIGTSSDGTYLLIQSQATDFVPNQVTPPGQYNLFWYDTSTSERKLISAFDPPTGSLFKVGTKSLGVTPSVGGAALNAVISEDGQSVAFISPANAAQFDKTLPLGLASDGGGDDLFVWSAATTKITLASRDKNGQALGGGAQVSNPALSPDGTVVSFVSTANARQVTGWTQVIDNQAPAAFQPDYFIYDDDISPDLFRYEVNGANPPQPVSQSQTSYSYTIPIFVNGKFSGFSTITNYRYQMHGNIRVDALNRYTTAGGAGYVAIRTNVNGTTNNDAWRYTYDPSKTLNPATQQVNPVVSLPAFFLPGTTSGPGALGVGTTDNIIASTISGEGVFAYKVVAAGGNLVTGYVNKNSQNPADPASGYDLYRVKFSSAGNTVDLMSAQAGSRTIGSNDVLDLDPRGYRLSDDGSKLVFTSKATNLVAGLRDINGTYDIFQRDTFLSKTSAISVTATDPTRTGNGTSRNPFQTPDGLVVTFESSATNLTTVPDKNGVTDVYVYDQVDNGMFMVSANFTAAQSANAPSFGAIVSRTRQIYPPPEPGYYRNWVVYFSSSANDLDQQATVPANIPMIYAESFPVFRSLLPRTLAYSGGINGWAELARLDYKGNVLNDAKYQPFPGWTGEVRVASADVTGDGFTDLIAGVGKGGGPRVVIIDGVTGSVVDDFFAFEDTFTGGVYVAAADVNGDGKADLIIGAGEGGAPRVQVYDGATGGLMFDAFVFEEQARSGVRVSSGDFNGDGIPDLYVAAGDGGGPRVRIFNGADIVNGNLVGLADFFAFEPSLRGGAYISGGDYNGDGYADVAVGGGPSGGPRISIFNAVNLNLKDPNVPYKFVDYFAFDQNSREGARPLMRNVNGDKYGDLVVGTGAGLPKFTVSLGGQTNQVTLKSTNTPFDEVLGAFGAWVG